MRSWISTQLCSLLLAMALCLAGCSLTTEEILDICGQTASTQHLLAVRPVDYDAIGSKYLIGTHQTVYVCSDHFALGSPSGSEFTSAAYEANRIEGSELLINQVMVGHNTKAVLYPDPATANYFDYVDNDLSVDPGIHPCHSAGSISCSDWVMNTCRHDGSSWSGSGTTAHWVVSVNAYCYDHYTDPASSDHPNRHGILHELAHAWGMNHTSSWDSADEAYISTMQGKLHYLSALDVAYLRHRYPIAAAGHQNYVASSKTRFDLGGGSFEKMVFWEDNPQELYVDGSGELKDCRTDGDPYFYVAWFNTGDLDADADVCAVNRLLLRNEAGDQEIDLHTWRIATMPYLSQDQWQGSISPDVVGVAEIDFSHSYDLVFDVNAWGSWNELTREDNELSYPIMIYNSSTCIPTPAPP